MIRLLGKDHRVSIGEREEFIRECAVLRPGPKVYLQTCNRVELYAGDGYCPRETANHLFRVTAGLESRMLGEKYVQGQVKRSYLDAVRTSTISSGLHRLFQAALRAGKRVRSETGLSVGAVGYSQAVMELLQQEAGCVADNKIVIIGVTRINERITAMLGKRGCESVVIVNRSFDRARDLADLHGYRAAAFGTRASALRQADIVITATSSDEPVVTREMVPHDKKMVIVDLAVPRDVSPLVGTLPSIRLFGVEQVEARIDQHINARQREIVDAEGIVAFEVGRFMATHERELSLC